MNANMMLPPAATAPRKNTTVVRRSAPQITVRADVCAHRGEVIGWVDCSCRGKPLLYSCDSPNVPLSQCIIHATGKPQGKIHLTGGPTDPESQSLKHIPVCAVCPHRMANAAEVIQPGPLRFFRTADLYARTLQLLQILPPFSAVVAIPRSGLLPGAIIATARHVPLLTLRAGQLHDVGAGLRGQSFRGSQAPYLLLDDTTWSGRQMARAVDQLAGKPLIRAAIYAHDQRHVDYCAAVVKSDFLVEWNLFNNPGLIQGHSAIEACRGGVAMGCDGVLCEEPPINEHADLAGHLAWLERAKPLHLPVSTPVKMICSGRLESWRDQTTRWLDRHAVRCDRLLLDPARTVQERDLFPTVAARKGAVFRDSSCTLFVESDRRQCEQIRELSKKTVVCLPTGEVFQ